ncbi:hypothetical protein P9133_31945 [Bacillus thuringiensis]|uniref:hypothetical protein n=1 Tax=Bacillus thuringiensis TaxID=1428 RepID=UPI0012FB2E18|nr:hypothetical protein [Bacillus thuringiensis]MEC3268931.1 hypothetical protein [Bacillus thuringiensis]MEC3515451.1 hypothetical protein [Bacillus thuringiensis]MED2072308.1 hypothetical protein [Bacillus thuringiensis]MED2223643.1 hypothetical protein [Bacillus thuringiensis]MED2282209.1 hypothetical protein [Bacillus thuringiensis]
MSKTLKILFTIASISSALTGVGQLFLKEPTSGLYFAAAMLLIAQTFESKEENSND